MTMKMRYTFLSLLALVLLTSLLPAAAFAASDGWAQEADGWRYYENGAPVTGVRWHEEEQHFYIFDDTGLLQTGDTDGDVFLYGNLYCINPGKNVNDPRTCYAVRNYTRNRPGVGITYYNQYGITYVGWTNAGGGGRMYQTRIPKERIGAEKDLYIYVWRAQLLPESVDPDFPNDPGRNIPAGWYLFDDNGILVTEPGWHDCSDGKAYRVNEHGQILEESTPDSAGEIPQTIQPELMQPETTVYDPALLPEGKLPMQGGSWKCLTSADAAYTATLTHINALRAEKGLDPLTMDEELSRIATERVQLMESIGDMDDHKGMDQYRFYDGGYRNEIAAKNAPSARSVCQGWKNSPGHYALLMNPKATRMGVGCVYNFDPYNRDLAYWSVVFAIDW